jgi:peptidoglycan/xylan/chitin deacetylase (PgdA/CDA1 family)
MAAAWFAPFDTWTHARGNNVALTFDGGPNDTATLAIASMLNDRGIGATFFVDGLAAAERPEIVEALTRDGHLVANNATRHSRSFIGTSLSGIDETSRTIANYTGNCPQFFRPPNGRKNPLLSWQVHQRGMAMVLGDVNPDDARQNNADKLAQSVLSHVRGGSIIVLHDGRNADPTADRAVLVEAVPKILAGLDARGLHPMRLDKLLRRNPTHHHCTAATTGTTNDTTHTTTRPNG